MNDETFVKTVVRSPEWRAWEIEICRRMKEHSKKLEKITDKKKRMAYRFDGVWDVDECKECNLISKEHWADFIKFIKTLP